MTHPTIAYLARCALHARALHPDPTPITLGDITLLPHQASAVRWLQLRITRYGGALLADPPGLGKTYVALAVAAQRHVRPLIIAPAALRTRWLEAATATRIPIEFVSTERLSAPATLRISTPAFVIVDEAHHLRSHTTRRHRRTAQLCAEARVLLLTATPIHNRAEDLECITTLFHMPPTRETGSALRKLSLRRTIDEIHAAGLGGGTTLRIPNVEQRRPISLAPRDGTIASAIARVPPIHPTRRDGHTLLQLGLHHTLRSSDAACAARVRHRIAATLAIEHAALAHVAATPALRKAWTTGDDAIQLAMPQLLGDASVHIEPDTPPRARRQRTALERMLPLLDGSGDARRAAVLRRIARWSTQPAVAFTQFTATAESLYRRLAAQPGIALLCGEQARIASGVIPRGEVLARLLTPDRRPHTAVRLLITTDVLSEGLSLTGVATIIHLDLPWTPARLDQRVGRAARIGSPVPAVRVLELQSSVPAGADVRLRALLRRKRRDMLQFEAPRVSEPARFALLRQLVEQGESSGRASSGGASPVRWVTVRTTQMRGASIRVVALVRLLGRRQLVAHDGGWLRAPSRDDWVAMAHASDVRDGAGRIVRHGLRALLHEHVDDEQMRAMLGRPADERLDARRAEDARLLDAGAQQRLAMAPHVSDARRALGQFTETAKVRALVASMQSLDRKRELTALAERAVGPGADRVVVYRGVVLLPA